MPPRRSKVAAFTLLELLLVVAIVAIIAAVVLPNSQPTICDQLRSTAQIVAAELNYARDLAVANNAKYGVAFDLAANRCVLSGAALDKLPATPFSSPADTDAQQILDLDDLPHVGPTVRLAAVATVGATTESIAAVEFDSLGQTTAGETIEIWLAAGSGENTRYITLTINPVTGLVDAGDYTSVGPP